MKRVSILSIIILLLSVIILMFLQVHSQKEVDQAPTYQTIKKQIIEPDKILDNCQEINLPGNYVLTRDIFAGVSCFNISADNIIMNGQGHTIFGDKKQGSYGISARDIKNITIINVKVADYDSGVSLNNVSQSRIAENNFISNVQGLHLINHADNNTIRDNTFASQGAYGLTIYSSKNNLIEKNLFEENIQVLLIEDNNDVESNIFLKNVHGLSKFQRDTPLIKDKPAEFSLILRDYNRSACDSCTYELETFPSEKIEYYKITSGINGSFIPRRKGIYSIRMQVNDKRNNTEIMKYIYLSNPTGEKTEEYYVRGKDPLHGQAISWGGQQADSGTLLFENPSTDEIRTCSDWIQISPDEFPEYLFGTVKEINITLPYTQNAPTAFVGAQRFASYDTKVDQKKVINSTEGKETRNEFHFSMNWQINYFWEWYLLAIKLSAEGGRPTIYIDSKNPPKAHITYLYSKTPAIQTISNKKITFLSATMDSEPNNARIELEGEGITTLTLKMPDITKKYKALYNNLSCDISQDCLLNHQAEGEMEFTLNIQGRKTLDIIQDDRQLPFKN